MKVNIYIKGRNDPLILDMDDEDLDNSLVRLMTPGDKYMWTGEAFIPVSSIDYITWED